MTRAFLRISGMSRFGKNKLKQAYTINSKAKNFINHSEVIEEINSVPTKAPGTV